MHQPAPDPAASHSPSRDSQARSALPGTYVLLSGIGLILLTFTILPFAGLAEDRVLYALISLPLLVLGFALLAVLVYRIRRDWVEPFLAALNWSSRIANNEFDARIPVPADGHFAELARGLNQLSNRFQSLALDMETQVRIQTEHIKKKTRSLEVLYDVAASINTSRDLDDLLTRFLHTLTDVVHARAATVRLLDNHNRMTLVASLGLSDDIVERELHMPSENCLCGQAARYGEVQTHADLKICNKLVGTRLLSDQDVEMIAVPLQYRGKTLGVYNLFVDSAQQVDSEDDRELLVSIGRHLGMAIEKAGIDAEAKRFSIIEERTRIAHELHDSLAQTLASLRFQVRVLDETLHQGDESALWAELERIENSLDEAYTELRNLIDHFRAPIDRRGLIPAIEKLVERFKRESSIQIFLQQDWGDCELPEDMEIQVLRIIQEALTNVRKHSDAHTVRVLMRHSANGHYSVLIEDDGSGIAKIPKGDTPGEHVGLSIMEERARRLGGSIRFESEPGEGTRILLNFVTPDKATNREVRIPVRQAVQ